MDAFIAGLTTTNVVCPANGLTLVYVIDDNDFHDFPADFYTPRTIVVAATIVSHLKNVATAVAIPGDRTRSSADMMVNCDTGARYVSVGTPSRPVPAGAYFHIFLPPEPRANLELWVDNRPPAELDLPAPGGLA